ncbi:MAG: putative transposase [Actinomycetota bacterium]|nr:putative transposase [Actinomycetota bacterium]
MTWLLFFLLPHKGRVFAALAATSRWSRPSSLRCSAEGAEWSPIPERAAAIVPSRPIVSLVSFTSASTQRDRGPYLPAKSPFLDDDVEIRKAICSTNAIESLNARYRRAVKARGHFPTEQAPLRCPTP